MTIDSDMAALVGFVCEAFFYGFYTVLFALSVYLMFNGPRGGTDVNKPILVISVFLFLCCSTHFALEFSHFYEVLATTGVKRFADETKVLVGADLLISITDFVGELILIYRCWLLWSKNYWIIMLPCLTAVAGPVCVSEVFHLLLHIHTASPAAAAMAPTSLVP
ncbi:hypothetical protein BJV77DRAFT_1097770 [Russula vinacea]|nr:hypothetical protein BJV77DRAFT_1097770 [Russula vinacea]